MEHHSSISDVLMTWARVWQKGKQTQKFGTIYGKKNVEIRLSEAALACDCSLSVCKRQPLRMSIPSDRIEVRLCVTTKVAGAVDALPKTQWCMLTCKKHVTDTLASIQLKVRLKAPKS